jgi:predicted MPP superfamily phosphohydrolase
MKNSQFIVFITVVLTIYLIGNLYIFFKGYNVIPPSRLNRTLYILIFAALATTFFAGRILESVHSSVFADFLNTLGGFWMGFLLYGFLFLIVSDITGLLLKITGVLNAQTIPDYRKWSFTIAMALSALFIAGGFINALIPVIREYKITIEKPADNVSNLRIAAVSDIHLGSIIRKRSMKKLSRMLDRVRPDVIFLLGDIVDGDLGPVLRGDLLKYFHEPVTRYGLYGITGNHEFIGGAERTITYIESKGIRLLKDEKVILPGGIQVYGRLDSYSFRFKNKNRLTLYELMKDADHSKPVILLDHQPSHLEESEKAGVDLQLSGHTHNGQMWPLNYITKRLFEVSYGYLKKGDTQIIVSSGFGLWGPRIRSGSRPEVMVIDVSFAKGQ